MKMDGSTRFEAASGLRMQGKAWNGIYVCVFIRIY